MRILSRLCTFTLGAMVGGAAVAGIVLLSGSAPADWIDSAGAVPWLAWLALAAGAVLVFVPAIRRVVARWVLIAPLVVVGKSVANATKVLWTFFRNPICAGAFSGLAFAFGLAAVWVLTFQALDFEVRPSPIELAGLAHENAALFLYTGVAWFVVHAFAIPFIIGLFVAHRGDHTPSLWAFTLSGLLAVLFWICFGLLSVPLGANVGPHYGEALARAQLTEDQTTLWENSCRPRDSLRTISAERLLAEQLAGRSPDWFEANCHGIDEPLLLADPQFLPGADVDRQGGTSQVPQLTSDQLLHLQEAWALSQDTWVVRKISDALYFGANGVFVFAMFFFCVFAVRSRVLNSFSITLAGLTGICYALGFAAFWIPQAGWVLLLGIVLHILWLAGVGIDLWDVRKSAPLGATPPREPIEVAPLGQPLAWDEVDAILGGPNALARNRQITVAYARLARQLDAFLHVSGGKRARLRARSRSANWCHFAVWASKTAGTYINPDDARYEMRRLELWRLECLQAKQPPDLKAYMQSADERSKSLVGARGTVTEAMASGNRLVFEEVSRLLVQFMQTFKFEGPGLGENEVGQRMGLEPGGLRRGIYAYYSARHESDPQTKAEWILLGNVELLGYEQERLSEYIERGHAAAFLWPLALTFPASLIRLGYRVVIAPLVILTKAGTIILRIPQYSFREEALKGERRWVGAGASVWLWFLQLRPLMWLSDKYWAETIVLVVGTKFDEHRNPYAGDGAPLCLTVGRPLVAPASYAQTNLLAGDFSTKPLWECFRRWEVPLSNHAPRVTRYRDLGDRMKWLIVLFRCYQFEPRVRDYPFSPQELETELIVGL